MVSDAPPPRGAKGHAHLAAVSALLDLVTEFRGTFWMFLTILFAGLIIFALLKKIHRHRSVKAQFFLDPN